MRIPSAVFLALLASLMIGGCATDRIGGFEHVREGMTRDEVRALLGAPSSTFEREVDDDGARVGAADGAGREVVGGDPAGGGARERDTGRGQGEDEQKQSGGREARTASDQRASSEWPGAGFARGRLFEESTDSCRVLKWQGKLRLSRFVVVQSWFEAKLSEYGSPLQGAPSAPRGVV